MKKMKGITLISLVITIIILIILAGVAINLTLGENGIFTKSQQAKEQYEMAEVKEKLNLAILEIQTEDGISGEELTLDTMLTKLQTKLPGIEISKEGNELKGNYDGYNFIIDESFKVTIEGYNPGAGNGGSEEEGTIKYTVTLNGSNVTTNGATQVNQNKSYTATLTPVEGYGIAIVEVKMGNTTLTQGSHYTYENKVITIANVTGNVEINVTAYQTVASQKTSEATYYDAEKTLIDSSGNIVKVPAGFKVAEDSGINVTEGIVIEDNDIKTGIGNGRGNQYVWIPVGTGIKKADGTTKDIILGRYRFADGETDMAADGENPLAKGTPILVQDIDNYTEQSSSVQIEGREDNRWYYEDIQQRNGVASTGTNAKNATALSILNFKTSVAQKNGYYMARYEASYGTDKKANSKVSNSAGTAAPTAEGTLWNNITQINAAVASRGLYGTVTSDLTNSYAWDTAIVYIQAFSGDEDYSYQIPTNQGNKPLNTGECNDELCKINDMASNVREWTTEYCSYIENGNARPSTTRGGHYLNSYYRTDERCCYFSTLYDSYVCFRTILY